MKPPSLLILSPEAEARQPIEHDLHQRYSHQWDETAAALGDYYQRVVHRLMT